jgi:putative transposase
MRKSRFNESQRKALVDAYLKGNKTVEQLCEEQQISPATFYKWKNELDESQHEEKRRLRELETENLRLKKMYAELQLKHEVVSEALQIAKKFAAHNKKKS